MARCYRRRPDVMGPLDPGPPPPEVGLMLGMGATEGEELGLGERLGVGEGVGDGLGEGFGRGFGLGLWVGLGFGGGRRVGSKRWG